MSDAAERLPWVIFAKNDRSKSVVIVEPDYPSARRRGAVRLGLKETDVDYAPVIEGESVKAAKARIARSIG
jgi:hypothetical protein